jgi:membrane protein
VKRYLALFKETWTEFTDDKAQRLGAALAYYTIFSIAPLMLIAVRIASIVFADAQAKMIAEMHSVMGPAVANSLTELLANARNPKGGAIATIVGIVTLLLGAAGVFGQLQDALNTIWNVETKPAGGVVGFIKGRFLSMAMVMGIGFLLLVSLIFDTALAMMGKWISARIPGGESLLHIVGLVVSFALITVLFAMMFRYLPDTRVEWRDVWLGAAFTSFLFALGKFALALYLGKGAVGSAYGAAGSLVIILVWVYWSAQILFFGAEFTQVYARRHGSKAKVVEVVETAPPQWGAGAPAGELRRGHGAFAKVVLSLFLGAILGGVGALMMLFKSAKKLVTLH